MDACWDAVIFSFLSLQIRQKELFELTQSAHLFELDFTIHTLILIHFFVITLFDQPQTSIYVVIHRNCKSAKRFPRDLVV